MTFTMPEPHEIGAVVGIAIAAFILGRRAILVAKNARIRGLELLVSRLERSAQEHQRAAEDLYSRVAGAEETVRKLERSIVEMPEIAQRLSATHDLVEIPERTLDLVQEVFDPAYSVFYKTRRGELIAVATRGECEFKEGHRLKPGEGIVGWTAVKQLAYSPADVRYESGVVRGRNLAKGIPKQGFSLCLPVMNEKLTFGVILLGPTERELPHAREIGRTIALITSVAMTSAAVLKQQKLLAKTDGLTGLFNRTNIIRRIQDIVDADSDVPRTLSLFLFDIDHFKHYNDTNGHLPGDELLRMLSKLLRENIREGEMVGRYGGEEFVLVMPDVDRNEALQAAERVRRLIASHEFPYGEKQPLGQVSVSGGVANWPLDEKDTEGILRCADDALYQAKRAGRNRVLPYAPPDLRNGDPYDPVAGEMGMVLDEKAD
jgi:diguanylate cyclase (GGDEF)-like protein